MAKARTKKIPEILSSMKRSSLESLIYEANLGTENTKIAKLYLIEMMAQSEIAEEVGLTRKTVQHRISWIIDRMIRVESERLKWEETDREQSGVIVDFPKITHNLPIKVTQKTL